MAKKTSRHNAIKLFTGVVLLIVAVVGLLYGSMLQQMSRAANDYRQGDTEGALKRYEAVEQRLRSFGAMRIVPARDRQDLLLNEARLLYALARYDEAGERLDRETEIAGVISDGRFLLLRGNIAFRKAIINFRESPTRDVNVLEEQLLAAEDTLRDSLRLNPDDWDTKYNYEFINYVRRLLTEGDEGDMNLLMENVRVKEIQPQALPPEQQK
ncbi:MAG: hypothetical protein HY649_03415 [Acidobacteria bacterium]|nr:hypothetical protein [Acidobacteriota bacterium]